jgi:hypothetical protein
MDNPNAEWNLDTVLPYTNAHVKTAKGGKVEVIARWDSCCVGLDGQISWNLAKRLENEGAATINNKTQMIKYGNNQETKTAGVCRVNVEVTDGRNEASFTLNLHILKDHPDNVIIGWATIDRCRIKLSEDPDAILIPTAHGTLKVPKLTVAQWRTKQKVIDFTARVNAMIEPEYQNAGSVEQLFPNIFEKAREEVVEDNEQLFEACDPRPVDDDPRPNIERVQFGGTAEQIAEAKKLVEALSKVLCEDLTKAMEESKAPLFRIDLKEGFRERRRTRPLRRRSQEEEKAVADFIAVMVRAGMIKDCNVPQAASLVLVRQKSKIRICVDFRELNEGTIVDQYPQARSDEILGSLHGCKYFSTLDATSGYWQVGIEKASQYLTAFKTKLGTYMWTRLPFGLVNAPAHYNRWMEKVLAGLPVFRYVDDIIIATETWEDHIKVLRQVLERCEEHGVKIKASKCHIGKQEVEILGHTVSKEGIRPTAKKVAAILDMKAPSNAKELKTFMGCVSFYRRYCMNLSATTHGMRQLLKKGAKYDWTAETQKEFEDTKKLLTSKEIMLAHPDPNKPFYIHVDASRRGIGACLMQEVEGPEGMKTLKVIEYFSQSLKGGEIHYGITDLEGLGIVKAVERWHPYVYGGDLTVVTDHKPLLSMKKSSNPRLIRWSLRMAPYAFQLRWKAGEDHVIPDALSRAPIESDEQTDMSLSVVASASSRKVFIDAAESDSNSWRPVTLRKIRVGASCSAGSILDMSDDEEEDEGGESPSSVVEINDDEDEKGNESPESAEDDARVEDAERKVREKRIRAELHTLRLMREAQDLKSPWISMQSEDVSLQKLKGLTTVRGLLQKNGKVVVPIQMRNVLLHLAHGDGHSGLGATSRLLEGFYWPRKKWSIVEWIRGCKCQQAKMQRRPDGTRKLHDGYRAFEAIVIDYLVDTLDNALSTGTRYILCIVDRATGYCRLGLTKDRSAAETARTIRDRWIKDFGCPRVIMSDNEKAVSSGLTKYLTRVVWMSKLIFFAPYQKTGGGMVERAIQNAETKTRSSIVTGDIEDGRHIKDWIRDIEWACNTTEGKHGSSAFERVYGVRPRTPFSMAIPISLNLSENERRKWQGTLRNRTEANRVRAALANNRKPKGSKFQRKVTDFEKGQIIWVAKEGTGVSSLDADRWQPGEFLKIRKGQRSARVIIGKKTYTRRLEAIRERFPADNKVPTDEEIGELLNLNNDEPDAAIPEVEGKQPESFVDESQHDEEQEGLQMPDVEEIDGQDMDDEVSVPPTQMRDDFVPETQPNEEGKDDAPSEQVEESDMTAQLPRTSSRKRQRSGQKSDPKSKKRKKRKKSKDLPMTQNEVVAVQDRNNGQAYLSLRNKKNGKFIMLKRCRKKRKAEYHISWWKENPKGGAPTEKTQKTSPGVDWNAWECSPEQMKILENFGTVMAQDHRIPPEYDDRYLKLVEEKSKEA